MFRRRTDLEPRFSLYAKRKAWLIGICLLITTQLTAQSTGHITGFVKDSYGRAMEAVTVRLLKVSDSSLVKIALTKPTGDFTIEQTSAGTYFLYFTAAGFTSFSSASFTLAPSESSFSADTIILQPAGNELSSVTVSAQRQLVEQKPGRTLINVEAALTNAGATALEVLEKSPGVTVDKDGNISLKGRPNVLVLIDGKPTYLSGSNLAAMLGGLSASQLDQIELMTNPPAQYDASGNSGIINIKTKKIRQAGWNGNVNLSYGQGDYPKTANSINLNYRNNKVNLFLNYNLNGSRNYTDLYSFRTYLANDLQTPAAYFEQPTLLSFKGINNNLKVGMDLFLNKQTTLGVMASGFIIPRTTWGNSNGYWKDLEGGGTDSVIVTRSLTHDRWRNGTVNFNFRHQFRNSGVLTADLDHLEYRISNSQEFKNLKYNPDHTLSGEETIRGDVPVLIRIYSAKADYSQIFSNGLNLEAGWKSSYVTANNHADYKYLQGNLWVQDEQKTNYFLYKEQINAAYVNLQRQWDRWTVQGGLRYEATWYNSHQLGSAQQKDSSLSRNYGKLFPSASLTYQADSNHVFNLAGSFRIDRPAFQKLNPFTYVLNKYTYQKGNPLIQPQYTFHLEASHTFKNFLTTTLNYSRVKNYFSQVFYSEHDIMVYTEGNLTSMQQIGASVNVQLRPFSWWSASVEATGNYNRIRGFVVKELSASNFRLETNISNIFHLPKGWSAELSGYYTSNEQELQEITYPLGQLSAGVGKQILQSKGTLKLSARDIFHTIGNSGLTTLYSANEYFRLNRDTRVVTLSFAYRFGKAGKETRKSNGGADEEMKRMNGN